MGCEAPTNPFLPYGNIIVQARLQCLADQQDNGPVVADLFSDILSNTGSSYDAPSWCML